MPQITCPDPLHLTTISQLTEDGINEVALWPSGFPPDSSAWWIRDADFHLQWCWDRSFSIILLVYMSHQLFSHAWLSPIIERIRISLVKDAKHAPFIYVDNHHYAVITCFVSHLKDSMHRRGTTQHKNHLFRGFQKKFFATRPDRVVWWIDLWHGRDVDSLDNQCQRWRDRRRHCRCAVWGIGLFSLVTCPSLLD